MRAYVGQSEKKYVRGPCSFCHLYMLNSETEIRAVLGFCSRGGKIAVSAYQGGQALHAVHYNIYTCSKISRGGQTSSKGGGGANAPLRPPPPPLNATLEMVNLPKKFTVGLYFVLEAVVLFFFKSWPPYQVHRKNRKWVCQRLVC